MLIDDADGRPNDQRLSAWLHFFINSFSVHPDTCMKIPELCLERSCARSQLG